MEIKTTEATLSFNLLDQIGNGGEGNVYKALDLQMDATIAIKKVPKSIFTDQARYYDESKKLYATEHINVVPIRYGCEDADYVYLAMPYFQRGSMKGLTDQRFLTASEVIRYSIQFLSGLNNVHSKGLIHFDIKTENILINDANQACISDFGLAQYTGLYGFSSAAGTTLLLAPPEYFVQAQHNLKFDIYQTGLTIYRMCNGDVHFNDQIGPAFLSKGVHADANFIKNLSRGKFPNRSLYLPHIPKKLRSIINTALNPDPNKRYSTVLDMLNDLNKCSVNDWQYSTDGTNETWTKDGIFNVTCSPSKGSFVIIATKNSRKNHTFSKKVSLADKNALLYNCLNSNW